MQSDDTNSKGGYETTFQEEYENKFKKHYKITKGNSSFSWDKEIMFVFDTLIDYFETGYWNMISNSESFSL